MADAVVELTSGFIRGVVQNHEDGFNYYAFKNIPYGESPTGELRFQDPVPKTKWTEILDCRKYGPIGFQYDLITEEEHYDEECLNLNVFTHTINCTNVNRPVMVYIHGGDFHFGTANDYYCGPDYLIRKDIVLVTVNFRLGVLGFLDTEDEVAPGNQGLKDIILALQWIQLNIRVLGGNPNNVTIFGGSSGAACAHYIAISPLSRGLIHKVISQTTTAYCPWAALKNAKSHAIKFCSLVGKELTDSKDIVAFLKTIDAKTLLRAQLDLRKFTDTIPFGPGVDSKSSNPFMPVPRHALADQGVQLPYLAGYNAHSGLIVLLDNLTFTRISREEFFKMCDLDFEKILLFNAKDVLDQNKLNAQQLRKLYYKSEKLSNNNVDKFVDMATDIYFSDGIQKLARVQTEKSSAPMYLYRFAYDTPDSISKAILKDAPSGAGLHDELPYLFKLGMSLTIGHKPLVKGTRNYKMMQQLTEMWANFATYGRPTVDTSDLIPVHWKPVTDGTLLRYLNIDEDITMQSCINVDQKFLSATQIKV